MSTRPLKPDFLKRGKDGHIYSIHAPGLSLIVAPAFALCGYPGVLVGLVPGQCSGQRAHLARRMARHRRSGSQLVRLGRRRAVGAFFLSRVRGVSRRSGRGVDCSSRFCRSSMRARGSPDSGSGRRGARRFPGCTRVCPAGRRGGARDAARLVEDHLGSASRLAAFAVFPVDQRRRLVSVLPDHLRNAEPFGGLRWGDRTWPSATIVRGAPGPAVRSAVRADSKRAGLSLRICRHAGHVWRGPRRLAARARLAHRRPVLLRRGILLHVVGRHDPAGTIPRANRSAACRADRHLVRGGEERAARTAGLVRCSSACS